MGSVPPGSEPRGGQHVRVRLNRLKGKVDGIAHQHHPLPPHAGVDEDHPVPLLGEASQESRRCLIFGCEDILSFEAGPHLHLERWMLLLLGLSCPPVSIPGLPGRRPADPRQSQGAHFYCRCLRGFP